MEDRFWRNSLWQRFRVCGQKRSKFLTGLSEQGRRVPMGAVVPAEPNVTFSITSQEASLSAKSQTRSRWAPQSRSGVGVEARWVQNLGRELSGWGEAVRGGDSPQKVFIDPAGCFLLLSIPSQARHQTTHASLWLTPPLPSPLTGFLT